MNGLELSRAFYEEYGVPMLKRDFPDLLPYLAVGLVGAGSECFGFDDEASRDHDYAPGFCIFLPGEEVFDRRKAFILERAYAKLPKEFEGVVRPAFFSNEEMRRGVVRTSEFYLSKTGSETGELTTEAWLSLPDHYLAQATNGEVFFDAYGEFSRIRQRLLDPPADILRKKIAGHLWEAAQAGQYNYARCQAHGERAAAVWALCAFADHASTVLFLLHGRWAPFYKWRFRALKTLDLAADAAALFETLLCGEEAEKKAALDAICALLIARLRQAGYTGADSEDLARLAHEVNDGITDPNIRNLNILAAV